MGRIFLDHIGGSRLFTCNSCDTILTNKYLLSYKIFCFVISCCCRNELISTRFTGATGRAFLFNKVSVSLENVHTFCKCYSGTEQIVYCIFVLQVVNLKMSEVMDRVMLTGRHMVRDVFCKNCDAKLGWMYEFATEDNQRYKEGRVILERALIQECNGIDEHPVSD